jgi:hypothetical protein
VITDHRMNTETPMAYQQQIQLFGLNCPNTRVCLETTEI